MNRWITALVAFGVILLNYFIWGVLDAFGGVKALFGWAGASANQTQSWLAGQSCLYIPSGDLCMPDSLLLIGILFVAVFFLLVGIWWLVDQLRYNKAEEDEEFIKKVAEGVERYFEAEANKRREAWLDKQAKKDEEDG